MKMHRLSFLAATACCLVAMPSVAAPYTYSPDHCEVSITFPEKPYIQNKCTGADTKSDCTEVVSYTKNSVDTGSSINFRVTCHTAESKELDKYTPPIMEETLKKMIKDAGLEPYNLTSKTEDGFKKAAAVSVGQKDGKTDIYSGQIWIGITSIFTLEAEMIGPKNDTLEKTFASILKDTKAKTATEKPAAAKK